MKKKNLKNYIEGNMKKLCVSLLSIFVLTSFFIISCDTDATDTTTDKKDQVTTHAYFLTDSSGSSTGEPNWYTRLNVTTDTNGSFYTGYGAGNGDTLTFSSTATGGADGTSEYFTLTGAGTETWAAGGWDIDGTATTGTNLTAAEYQSLVFWAKSAASTQLSWGLEDVAGANVELPIAISDTWTKYAIPLSDFEGVDLATVNIIKYVLPDNAAVIDIDEVYLSKADAPTTIPPASQGPSNGPTAPTRAQADVLSVYSDTYTAIGTVIMNAPWGQTGSAEEVDINGNNAYKYSNLTYQGIAFDTNSGGAGPQDVREHTLHLDIWTPNSNTDGLSRIRIFIIEEAGGEGYVDVDLTPGAWTPIDIPLTGFTAQNNALDLIDVHQLKLDPANLDPAFAGKTIYVDNIYFY